MEDHDLSSTVREVREPQNPDVVETPAPTVGGAIASVADNSQEQIDASLCTSEIVSDPNSPLFEKFYEKLSFFKKEEVEPKEILAREILSGQCTLLVVHDPDGNVTDFAYGSLIDGRILAFRFTGAEVDPNIRAGQGADKQLLEVLRQQGSVDTLLVEATSSEAGEGWNRVEVEPDNGMKWVYLPDGSEMEYGLPPFEWELDGTPVDPTLLSKPQSEHLQVAIQGSPDSVSGEQLAIIVRALWEAWYVRPENEFHDRAAWNKHRTAIQLMLGRYLEPLLACESVTLKKPTRYKEMSTGPVFAEGTGRVVTSGGEGSGGLF